MEGNDGRRSEYQRRHFFPHLSGLIVSWLLAMAYGAEIVCHNGFYGIVRLLLQLVSMATNYSKILVGYYGHLPVSDSNFKIWLNIQTLRVNNNRMLATIALECVTLYSVRLHNALLILLDFRRSGS